MVVTPHRLECFVEVRYSLSPKPDLYQALEEQSVTVYSEEAGKIALALVDAIAQMSDEAQRLGGATSIAGIASLHKMQTSIQKNLPRITAALKEAKRASS